MSNTVVSKADFERPNFDRLALVYRWMEWFSFGPYLWWCRTAFLPQMAHSRRALTFGDGDGRFTARLLATNPLVRIDAVDLSPAMLSRLKRNAEKNAHRVQTVAADARTWTPAAGKSFDLIYTHFFLDCLTSDEVRAVAHRIGALLMPGGGWVVSEFAIPRGGVGRWLGIPVVGFLYRAFGVLTGLSVRRLPDHHAALQSAGLKMVEQKKLLFGLLAGEYWIHEPGDPSMDPPGPAAGQMLQSC